MITHNKKLIFIICLNLLFVFSQLLPLVMIAQAETTNYQLLEPSIIIDKEGVQPETYGLKEYLQTAYVILFVLVICAAVFYLVLGGLEYILSDIPNTKLDGMNKFKKAMLGIAIASLSVIFLELINPDLLDFKLDFPN